jgi:ABC-type antimicrobial peptide transport system permease subunit
VKPAAYEVHERFRLVAGRLPSSGRSELLVGRSVAARYKGTQLGSRLNLGRQQWVVVGLFEAGGGSFESEIWTDAESLMSDMRRHYYSAVTLKLRDLGVVDAFARQVADDPRVSLQAKREVDYYDELTQTAAIMRGLGMLVAFIMAIGAVFAAMNTMYAAILSRTKEIGTLRALGFTRASILASFVIESLLVTLPGGIIGCLLALPVHGVTSGTLNMQNFTDIGFEFRISGAIVMGAAAFALGIGLAGGLLPARHAARLPITQALREI